MRKKLFTFYLLLAFQTLAWSQSNYNPGGPDNNYRSAQNPYYWKNRLPYPSYWQQDVHYQIKAKVDEQALTIDGQERLTYWNNSPDTLYFVFFHLYQEAFQPGAHLDDLQKNNGVKTQYGRYESMGLGTEVDFIKVNGKKLKTEQDNTVLKVWLEQPLLPNSSTTFDIDFFTYFDTGSTRRRMKTFNSFGARQLNGVHWYPAICVYDSKKGWDTDQHLNREFYNEFGTWDVELTFANNYIVEATGVLQNEHEVLPAELKAKLDIKNFKNKPWNEKPSVVVPYDSTQKKTWKYHAENVHNFAFTANPHYRIGETVWKGVRCIALVQEPHASQWQEVADFTAKVVEIYSADFGMYGYPKMVVADAEDGMEYPMLTLCGGSYPSNKGLIAHEVGHNWFYGMVGNNETYQAALDEGFTQFLTAWSLEKIDGIYTDAPKEKGWKGRFRQPDEIRNIRVYDGYLFDASYYKDEPLNTHSDMFHGALGQGGGYRHVYMKTATMLYNLQYTLGDSLFQNAMRHYFSQWSYVHPYIQDFRKSISQYTNTDLDWFFDQWFETTKNIDYKVVGMKQTGKTDDGQLQYQFKIKRKGRMQMPIDVALVLKNGDTVRYYIPNTWFEKETNDSILPRWIGWDKLHPTYIAQVSVPAKIKDIIIDPSERLADINMLNNARKPKVDVAFDSYVYNRPSWKEYTLRLRPELWWNAFDGFKPGFHMNGNYLGSRQRFRLTIWGNTGLGQALSSFNIPDSQKKKFDKLNYNFYYETSLNKWISDSKVYFSAKFLDGLEAYVLGFYKQVSPKFGFNVNLKSMVRPRARHLDYLLYPNEWLVNKHNYSLNVEFIQNYNYQKGNGRVSYYLRSTAWMSKFDYHYLAITATNNTALWKFDLRTRLYGRYGTGSNVAPESALYLAGASPEDLMEFALTRSKGFVPEQWLGYNDNATNHFQQGGGLNLRGYAGYSVIEEKDSVTYRAYKGNSGGALNAELDIDRLIPFKPKKIRDLFHLDLYLFGDAGFIVYQTNDGEAISSIRADAGAGTALTIKRFGPFETLKPFTIRFDVPFYISNAPAAEPDNIKFRWVVGFNRSF
ncbi:MAG: M1 family metallopeptidase [Chitinophagales bacterium]|nr:M1 family metallopeptidase [Chitinophagales bacterium]